MAPKATSIDDDNGLGAVGRLIVSTKEFAALVKLSPEALRLRIVAGEIPKVGHGKLDFMAAVQAFFAGEKRRIEATRARTLASPRVRYDTVRADQIEAKMAREAKGLISREEADRAILQVTGIVAASITVMAQNLVEKFPEVDFDPAEFSAMIERVEDAGAKMRVGLLSGDLGR